MLALKTRLFHLLTINSVYILGQNMPLWIKRFVVASRCQTMGRTDVLYGRKSSAACLWRRVCAAIGWLNIKMSSPRQHACKLTQEKCQRLSTESLQDKCVFHMTPVSQETRPELLHHRRTEIKPEHFCQRGLHLLLLLYCQQTHRMSFIFFCIDNKFVQIYP